MRDFKRFLIVIFSIAVLFAVLFGQTTEQEIFNNLEKSAGVYYAYPVQESPVYTAPPTGYYPFYISHYGRHGSRWLTSENDYTETLEIFKNAAEQDALTGLGRDVYSRLKIISENARGRAGDLSPLGVRQHRGIAERMYLSFPEVFTDSAVIDCRSTVVPRCILSMSAFSERLKELNPELKVTRTASHRDDYIMNTFDSQSRAYQKDDDSKWRKGYNELKKGYSYPEDFKKRLFTNYEFTDSVDYSDLILKMWRIASSMQNVDLNISLYDIFSEEELLQLWQIQNTSHYLFHGPAAGMDVIISTSIPLLRYIINTADDVIDGKSDLATSFKFGHDVYLMPLAGLMNLENCNNKETDPYKIYWRWTNFNVSPMGGNIQLIFFRKDGDDDIVVKFMLNEAEILVPPIQSDIKPFYHWEDVKTYYEKRMEKMLKDVGK